MNVPNVFIFDDVEQEDTIDENSKLAVPDFDDAVALLFFFSDRVSGHKANMCRHPNCRLQAYFECKIHYDDDDEETPRCHFKWCAEHSLHRHAQCPFGGCNSIGTTVYPINKTIVCCMLHYHWRWNDHQRRQVKASTTIAKICDTCKHNWANVSGQCDGCQPMWVGLKGKVAGPFG